MMAQSYIVTHAAYLRKLDDLNQIVAVMPRNAQVEALQVGDYWTKLDFLDRNRQGWGASEWLLRMGTSDSPAQQPVAAQILDNLGPEKLLETLRHSDYYATEGVATRLRSSLTPTHLAQLLGLMRHAETALLRRNVLRVIGRLAEAHTPNKTHFVHQIFIQTSFVCALTTMLTNERSNEVLQDALWLLDTYCYPCFQAQKAVGAVVTNRDLDSAVRFRAMGVARRLLYASPTLLSDGDIDFIVGKMEDSDPWVRAEAAFICEVLKPAHVNTGQRSRLLSGLNLMWANERDRAVRPLVARAVDKANGDHHLSRTLRQEYERVDLPNEFVTLNGRIRVRSSLSLNRLQYYAGVLEAEQRAFFDLMGANFHQPVPKDTAQNMTLIVYGSRQTYREHMSGFVGWGTDAGGLYIERESTLYTFEHVVNDRYSTEDLIKHEFGHYLQGRYVYPGMWGEVGYHEQPKGWADEGMAEFLAGLEFDSAGQFYLSERAQYVKPELLCGDAPLCDLAGLLQRRAGYDVQTGEQFDYMNGWAFVYFLMKDRRALAQKLYASMRDGSYRLADFAALAGVNMAQLQGDWHAAMRDWCAQRSDEAEMDGTECVVHHFGDPPAPVQPAWHNGAGFQPQRVVRVVG